MARYDFGYFSEPPDLDEEELERVRQPYIAPPPEEEQPPPPEGFVEEVTPPEQPPPPEGYVEEVPEEQPPPPEGYVEEEPEFKPGFGAETAMAAYQEVRDWNKEDTKEFTARIERGARTGTEELKAGVRQMSAEALRLQRNPYLGEDPEKAKADVPVLEKQLAEEREKFKALGGDPNLAGMEARYGIELTPEQKAQSAKMGDLSRQLTFAKQWGVEGESLVGKASKFFERKAEEARDYKTEILAEYGDRIKASSDSRVLMKVADSLGASAPSMGASMLNPVFGLSLMYSQTYESSREDFLKKGGDPAKADEYAHRQAALQTPFELVGDLAFAKLAKNTIKRIVTEKNPAAWSAWVKDRAVELGKATAGEVLVTTPGQTVVEQKVGEQYGTREYKTPSELAADILEAQKVAALQSLFLGGGTTSVEAGYRGITGAGRAPAVAPPVVPPATVTGGGPPAAPPVIPGAPPTVPPVVPPAGAAVPPVTPPGMVQPQLPGLGAPGVTPGAPPGTAGVPISDADLLAKGFSQAEIDRMGPDQRQSAAGFSFTPMPGTPGLPVATPPAAGAPPPVTSTAAQVAQFQPGQEVQGAGMIWEGQTGKVTGTGTGVVMVDWGDGKGPTPVPPNSLVPPITPDTASQVVTSKVASDNTKVSQVAETQAQNLQVAGAPKTAEAIQQVASQSNEEASITAEEFMRAAQVAQNAPPAAAETTTEVEQEAPAAPAAVPTRTQPEPAVVIGGQMFTGPTHDAAVEAAQQAVGPDAMGAATTGWAMPDNKFVSHDTGDLYTELNEAIGAAGGNVSDEFVKGAEARLAAQQAKDAEVNNQIIQPGGEQVVDPGIKGQEAVVATRPSQELVVPLAGVQVETDVVMADGSPGTKTLPAAQALNDARNDRTALTVLLDCLL